MWINRGQIVEKVANETIGRAEVGNGCHHCERGKPIDRFSSRAGADFRLCLECVLDWWPGKDVIWWEERHNVFADHIAEAIKAAREREFNEMMRSRLGDEARKALHVGG